MSTVYAILVTYNPEIQQLRNAVESLVNQCDKVVICNNSSSSIEEYNSCDNIEVFNFYDNLGIAEAQSIGMNWAFSNGADFIIQMDQDSLLPDKMVTNLVGSYFECTNLGYKVGVIGPRHFDKVSNEVDLSRLPKGKTIKNTNLEIVNETISSASLIPCSAFYEVGEMENELFIDLVDWEYCWRLKSFGFLTIRNNDLLLPHRVGDGLTKIIGRIDARTPAPIRHYYHTRNIILMLGRKYVPLSFKLKNIMKIPIKIVTYPFCFEDGKVRIHYIFKGVKDGVLMKKGKIS
ncbi:glycosyltransferase family 2 protein [Vibrio sp. 10N.286.48.B7]|uniref:glycosyltransferase family 2 protein n=1 Tax=Vibrio sp. 10N.286.48.B7 TaxID=1880853 RepID=UPI0039A49D0B